MGNGRLMATSDTQAETLTAQPHPRATTDIPSLARLGGPTYEYEDEDAVGDATIEEPASSQDRTRCANHRGVQATAPEKLHPDAQSQGRQQR